MNITILYNTIDKKTTTTTTVAAVVVVVVEQKKKFTAFNIINNCFFKCWNETKKKVTLLLSISIEENKNKNDKKKICMFEKAFSFFKQTR